MAFLILFQLTGTFLMFKLKQTGIRQEIKAQIKAGVPESQRVLLHFPLEQNLTDIDGLIWVHDHEFIFEGQLYDIVEQSVKGSEIVFSCIPDHQEQALFKNLSKRVANAMTKGKPHTRSQVSSHYNWTCNTVLEMRFMGFANFQTLTFPYAFIAISWNHIPEILPPKV